ncbi:hypothetical protein CC80DRAFT_510221 [Byssothecium circinans]|uniref:Uncharacterized protein n=1 Tax=Byssothecium circinans TaxID=147558 RepID=A0A6A5TB85_9PLEO|nr:hypothetical protein CC80DRAFT_510221 [Byssothecium circinans]
MSANANAPQRYLKRARDETPSSDSGRNTSTSRRALPVVRVSKRVKKDPEVEDPSEDSSTSSRFATESESEEATESEPGEAVGLPPSSILTRFSESITSALAKLAPDTDSSDESTACDRGMNWDRVLYPDFTPYTPFVFAPDVLITSKTNRDKHRHPEKYLTPTSERAIEYYRTRHAQGKLPGLGNLLEDAEDFRLPADAGEYTGRMFRSLPHEALSRLAQRLKKGQLEDWVGLREAFEEHRPYFDIKYAK